MSRRLEANAPYLHVLAKGSRTQRNGVLKGANKDLVECLCECALNILHGNVPLTSQQKRNLRCHKNTLRSLGSRTVSLTEKKKKLVNQKGGFISALAVPVLSILGELVIGGIKKGIARRRQRRTKK